jgi:hypothetical protein
MVCIILDASPEVEAEAVCAGFKKRTVLMREDPVPSTQVNKRILEGELFAMKPWRFLVSDTWGACIE